MSRTKQSVEEAIIEFFNGAPQANVDLLLRLASGIVRKRFPASKSKSVAKKASKKSLSNVAATEE
jgi:hypothetical protein